MRLNRLKELRKEKKISQKKLSEIFGVTEKTISRWENEEVQIKPDKTQELADYFGVSVSYLHGYGYNKQETKPVEKLESIFVEFLVNINTISDIDLEDLKGFSNKLYEMAICEKTRRLYDGNNEI